MVRARYTRAHPLLSLSVLVPRSSRDGRGGKEEGYDTRAGLEIRLTVNLSRLPLLFSSLIKREIQRLRVR